jgi:hypothetical protein
LCTVSKGKKAILISMSNDISILAFSEARGG